MTFSFQDNNSANESNLRKVALFHEYNKQATAKPFTPSLFHFAIILPLVVFLLNQYVFTEQPMTTLFNFSILFLDGMMLFLIFFLVLIPSEKLLTMTQDIVEKSFKKNQKVQAIPNVTAFSMFYQNIGSVGVWLMFSNMYVAYVTQSPMTFIIVSSCYIVGNIYSPAMHNISYQHVAYLWEEKQMNKKKQELTEQTQSTATE